MYFSLIVTILSKLIVQCIFPIADVHILGLQDLCRVSIRGLIRRNIYNEHPDLKTIKRKKPKKAKNMRKKYCRRRPKKMDGLPMSMGMMILNGFDDSDESDIDNEEFEEMTDNSDEQDDSAVDGVSDEDSEEAQGAQSEKSPKTKKNGRRAKTENDEEHTEPRRRRMELKADFADRSLILASRLLDVMHRARAASSNQQGASSSTSAVEELREEDSPTASRQKTCDEYEDLDEDFFKQEDDSDSDMHADKDEVQSPQENEIQNSVEQANDKDRKQESCMPNTEDFKIPVISSDSESENDDVLASINSNLAARDRKQRCISLTSVDTSTTSGIGSLSEASALEENMESEVTESPSEKLSPSSSSDGSVQVGRTVDSESDPEAPPQAEDLLKKYMMERIQSLPLPESLKLYLMHYRN